MCAGKPAGSEAAVHAMKKMFEEEDTHGVILVDAANAFNAMNRKSLLHNITVISPVLAKFAHNNYQKPARVFITGGKEISSEEGITQGDPAAMPFYAIGLVPVQVNTNLEKTGSRQVAFADDVNAAGEVKTSENGGIK